MVMVSMCLPKTYGGLAELANQYIKASRVTTFKKGEEYLNDIFLLSYKSTF